MAVGLASISLAILVATLLARRYGDRRELERHIITPEALHALLVSSHDVVVVDVRQPLDLLGDSVIIPGAVWFPPRQVANDPSILPRSRDLVVYCTCPTDKTSRLVLQKALARGFSRIKFLEGGLDGWRAKGYPVEPYEKSFRLDSDANRPLAAAS